MSSASSTKRSRRSLDEDFEIYDGVVIPWATTRSA